MRINLRLNKEIIDGFFKALNFKEIENLYNKKLKEENDNLIMMHEKMKKEIEEILRILFMIKYLF